MMKEAFDTPKFSSGKHIRLVFVIYTWELALKDGIYSFGSCVHLSRESLGGVRLEDQRHMAATTYLNRRCYFRL